MLLRILGRRVKDMIKYNPEIYNLYSFFSASLITVFSCDAKKKKNFYKVYDVVGSKNPIRNPIDNNDNINDSNHDNNDTDPDHHHRHHYIDKTNFKNSK